VPAWFHRPEHPSTLPAEHCGAGQRTLRYSCGQVRLPGAEGGAGAGAGAEAGAAACSVMSNLANFWVVFS
jgi:hypothetical protein